MSRVLQAIRTVDARQTGGAEELVLLLAPALHERRHFEPVILLLRKPDSDADPARDFGTRARKSGLKVLPLQDMKWRYGWLRALPGRLDLSVIHMHGQRANYFIWIMRRLFPRTWGRVPLVATVHGWVQDNFVRKVVTKLELGTLRDCDNIITVSDQQRRTLVGRGFAPDKVSVVRPGIPYLAAGPHGPATPEQKREAKAHWGLPEDAFVITAVGRLSTEKRFDLFIETCTLLSERLPGSRFMLVGGGKQEANLKDLASHLGLIKSEVPEMSDNHALERSEGSKLITHNSKLVFTGLTREMESVYAATDLLMLTSDTEGTPHVLLEAMGSGIPVVSTAVGGVPEFITSGVHGLLVPPGDKQALAEAAIMIHDDTALRDRLISEGRALAARFTVARMVEGVEEVYRKVTAPHE